MLKNYLISLLMGLGALLLFRCANPGVLGGGPRDTIPPQVVVRYPALQTTHFQDKEVYISFNEAVRSNNIKQEIIITPNIESEAFEIFEKKYTIGLRFKQKLMDSTTYSIYFRNGIVDVTERNPAQDAFLIFSTGNFIDSLEISGSCLDALTQEALDKVIVGLYPYQDTLDPSRDRPLYLAKTDQIGKFQLTNLRSGTYYLFAIEDKNNNSRLDKNEKIGYLEKPIQLDSQNIRDLHIELVRQDLEAPQIVSNRVSNQYGYFLVNFNEGLSEIQISPPTPYALTQAGRSLKLYPSDSTQIIIIAQDSTGNQLQDSLKIFPGTRSGKEELKLQISENYQVYQQYLNLVVEANQPIASANDSLFYALFDKDTLNKHFFHQFKEVVHPNLWQFSLQLSFKDSASVYIEAGWLNGIWMDSSQTTWEKKYIHANPKDFGSIKIQVKNIKPEWRIQLLEGKNNKLILEQAVQEHLEFRGLMPGEYRIRFYEDRNQNQRWDTGNYKQKILHERVFLYPKVLRLKANWQIEEVVELPL